MADSQAPHVPLDEIEWRIDGDIDGGGGVRVVCYLDVPTVTRLLDEWVGPWRWSNRYEPTGKEGVMWCHLSVADDDGAWVTKSDLGTASNFEADKGLVSDALKRVAMRQWGIGRNVFGLPVLRLPEGQFRTYESRGKVQAALTDKSFAWIAAELRRLGHDDAAKAAESTAPPADEGGESEPLASAEQRNEFHTIIDGLDVDKRKKLSDWMERHYGVDLDGFDRLSQTVAESLLGYVRPGQGEAA